MKNKILLLLGMFLFSFAFVSAFSGSGSGTEGDPYQITNCTQLQEAGSYLTSYFILMNNIDCSDTINWNSGNGFVPIGSIANFFYGYFDGQGYIISDLYINNANDDEGLFGVVSGGWIKNVGLENINVTALNKVGGLVGILEPSGLINNSYTTGEVHGSQYVGGLVGSHYSSGGGATIRYSYSNADVYSGSSAGGGLVGENGGTIEYCYATGDVYVNSNYAGGLTGINQYGNGIINNCYATGNVAGNSYVGGLSGTTLSGSLINSSYSKGNVTGSSNVGGLVGYKDGSSNSYGFWDNETSGQTTSAGSEVGKTTAEMKTLSTFTDAGWDIALAQTYLNDGYAYLGWQDENETYTWLLYETTPYSITDCKTSGWEAGQTYTLVTDISATGTCLKIDANNITLDFNGFNITGNGTGEGVNITNGFNVTLKNGAIYGFYDGIFIYQTNQSYIDNITANSNAQDGFWMERAYYNNFTNIIANQNGASGISIQNNDAPYENYNNFINITIDDGLEGMLLYGTNYNNFENINISNIDDISIYLSTANYNTFTNIITSYNFDGIVLETNSNNNTFSNVETNYNDDIGLWLTSGSESNNFINVTSNNNHLDIALYSANENIFNNSNFATYNFYLDTNVTFLNNDGRVYFVGLSGSGTDLMSDLVISNNYAFADSDANAGFNVTANVTFYNMPQNFLLPKVFRDGKPCLDCIAFTSLNAETVLFQVAGWSNYTVGDEILCGIISPTGNYTISGGTIIGEDGSPLLESNVNVSFDYTYTRKSRAGEVISDTTEALSGTSNWFSIIIVISAMVVLIFLTILIVRAIKKANFTA